MALEVTSTNNSVMYDFDPTEERLGWVQVDIVRAGAEPGISEDCVYLDSYSILRFTPAQFKAFVADLQRLAEAL